MLRKETSGSGRLELKAEGEGPGEIQGYANVFNVIDKAKEIVVPGAFAESVALFKAGKLKLPLMDNHRIYGGLDAVIGKVTELSEDNIGLKFKAIFASTRAAQEVRVKIREGMLDSLSIGYGVGLEERRRDGILLLKKIHLREISVVVFPANEEARISGVKGMRGVEGLKMAASARVAQLQRQERDLSFVEGRLADLDRKERMVEALERLSPKELSPEQLGFII